MVFSPFARDIRSPTPKMHLAKRAVGSPVVRSSRNLADELETSCARRVRNFVSLSRSAAIWWRVAVDAGHPSISVMQNDVPPAESAPLARDIRPRVRVRACYSII